MTGPFVPVGILNPIRAVVGIHHQRFNLFVKRSSAGTPPGRRYCFHLRKRENNIGDVAPSLQLSLTRGRVEVDEVAT